MGAVHLGQSLRLLVVAQLQGKRLFLLTQFPDSLLLVIGVDELLAVLGRRGRIASHWNTDKRRYNFALH